MPAIAETLNTVQSVADSGYKWGFETDIEMDFAPKGLNEDIVRLISERKGEPAWLLEWRLRAYRAWLRMQEPAWALLTIRRSTTRTRTTTQRRRRSPAPQSLDEVDPELLAHVRETRHSGEASADLWRGERAAMAVDAVFDSVSVATTFRSTLAKSGVIFCPISEAVREHPELVRQYLGSVVPRADNYFAALNSAVFTDGSFVFIPKGVPARWSCPPISASMRRTPGSSSAR